MNTEPMIGSIRGFQPSTAAQANPMSTYESAASNWARARDQMEHALDVARAALEEQEKAVAAEGEAWQAMQDIAGRRPNQVCAAQPAQRPR